MNTKVNSAVGDVDWNNDISIPSDVIIFKESWDRYGESAQMIVAMEELGELITAISQYMRGRDTTGAKLVEELADAYVVINNIVENKNLNEEVLEMYQYKTERLWRRMQT